MIAMQAPDRIVNDRIGIVLVVVEIGKSFGGAIHPAYAIIFSGKPKEVSIETNIHDVVGRESRSIWASEKSFILVCRWIIFAQSVSGRDPYITGRIFQHFFDVVVG